MAYRRKQGISRSATFKEEIPASAAPICHFKTKTKTLTSSYSFSSTPTSKGLNPLEDSRNDSKGFWGVLARKAKAILDDDYDHYLKTPVGMGLDSSTTSQQKKQGVSDQGFRKMENPKIQRGLDKLNSSLNHIGDTFEKAFGEGSRTIVENKTNKTRRKEAENQVAAAFTTTMKHQQEQATVLELLNQSQLKASRDVALATAAKAKLLLRELKTIKADLAFAKERCAQLEDEIKILREPRDKGDTHEDDDLIRVQLESLLAEKARLAHENSIYARENRFLREIVEYHQLSMQDVVYFDDADVTQVEYPIHFPLVSNLFCESPPLSASHNSPCTTSSATKEAILLHDIPSTHQQDQKSKDASLTVPFTTSTTKKEIVHDISSIQQQKKAKDARTPPPHSSLQT